MDVLQTPAQDTGLWHEHAPAVEAFLAVSGQWRVVPRFGAAALYLGLDYSATEAGWRMAGVSITPELMVEVQLIEAGAVETLNAGG